MSRSGNKRRGTFVAGADDTAFGEVKRLKRLRSHKRRQIRQQEQETRFYESILNDIAKLDSMTIPELAAFRSKLVKAKEMGKRDGDDTFPVEEVIALLDALFEMRKVLNNAADQAIRQVRLGQKRALDKHMEEAHAPKEVMCSRCNKRPRHFNDLCKRCADELGLRPTGKV